MAARKSKKPEPKKPSNIRREPFTSELRVPLKANEIADRADRAAVLEDEIEQKQDAAKAQLKLARSHVAQLSAEKRRLQSDVRTKAAYREVQCERRYLYDDGLVIEVRMDTGEETSSRPMTESEKQQFLPFSPEDNEKAGSANDLDDDFGGTGT